MIAFAPHLSHECGLLRSQSHNLSPQFFSLRRYISEQILAVDEVKSHINIRAVFIVYGKQLTVFGLAFADFGWLAAGLAEEGCSLWTAQSLAALEQELEANCRPWRLHG